MKQIIHIIKYKFIAFIRPETKISSTYILKNVGSGSIYFAFALGAFFFSNSLIKFLLTQVSIGQFLLHEFISMVLFIFFISINVGNIIVSYSTLYKSAEVNFLLTKPIPPESIFTIKFLDNFFYSSSTLLMVLFSLLAGYANYFQLSFISLTLLILNFIPYMISAGSLGVIILLLVLKLAAKLGVKKVIYGLISCYILFILMFFDISSPRLLVATVLKYYPLLDKDKYLGDLIPAAIKLLPNNWLSQTGYSIVHNDYATALSLSYLQIALAFLLFTLAFQLGKRYYFETWLLNYKLLSELNKKKTDTTDLYLSKQKIEKYGIDVISRKDILLFLREPSQIIHLLILFFLIAIFITSVSGIRYYGLGNFYLQTMIYLSIFIFNLLLIITLSLRFVFPMISLEGEAFWKIKSAPVKIKEFIFSKLVYTGLIISVVSLLLSFFSNFRFRLPMILFSISVTLLATFTIIVINFGMGSLFANYKEKNPIRLSSSQGASLSFLISLIYLLFLVVLLFKPLSGLFLSRMLLRHFNLMNLFWYFLPIMGISISAIIFFLKMGVKSLKKDF